MKLEHDAWLWHLGTGGAVRVVLLLNIYQPTKERIVRAVLSVSRIGSSIPKRPVRPSLGPDGTDGST